MGIAYWYYIFNMCWSDIIPPEIAKECPQDYHKLTAFYLLSVLNYLIFKYKVYVLFLFTLEMFKGYMLLKQKL